MAEEQGRVRGVDFITAPGVRSSRTRYVKAPLVQPRRGFLAWLASLFDRRPHPFIGSPIAEEIDGGLGFSAAVLAGQLQGSLTRKSTLVESVATRLLAYFQEASTRADNALDTIDDHLRQEELWLDECRPESIVSSLRGRLSTAEQETTGQLRTHTRDLVRARSGYEEFRARHALNDDADHGKHLDVAVLGQVGVLIIFEFILNSLFQGSLMKGGLLDGAMFALFTSMATVIVGLTIGIGTYLRAQPFARGGWFGWLAIGVGLLIGFLIVSELSLIRLAGDAGDLGALQTSVRQMSADPLAGLHALLELPALAYSVFIAFLIAAVAIKFRHYWGSYPGYWKHGLKLDDAKGRVDQLIVAAQDEMGEIGEEHKNKLQKAPDFIVSCKAPIRSLVADHENAIDQYHLDVSDIRSAARLFDCFIAEQGGEENAGLEAGLERPLDTFARKLEGRHATFCRTVDDLCAREDVSDASVDLARRRFGEALDDASGRLDANAARVLERSREVHHADVTWRPHSLTPAAV